MISNFTEYFAGFTTGAIALRLLFAAVLGCIIGLERATKHHPAGMPLRWYASERRRPPLSISISGLLSGQGGRI